MKVKYICSVCGKEHFTEKEEAEFTLIQKYINFENTADNKDKLLEQKIEKDVRRIIDFQAKRFAKFIGSV